MSYLKNPNEYSICLSDKAWKVLKPIVISGGIIFTITGVNAMRQGVNDKKQFAKLNPQSEFAQSDFSSDKTIVGGALTIVGLCAFGIGCLAKKR